MKCINLFQDLISTARRLHSSLTLNISCCCFRFIHFSCLFVFFTSFPKLKPSSIELVTWKTAMHSGKGSPPTNTLSQPSPPSELPYPQCNVLQRSSPVVLVWTSRGISHFCLFVCFCFFEFQNYGRISSLPTGRFPLRPSRFRFPELQYCHAAASDVHVVNTNLGKHVSLFLSLVSLPLFNATQNIEQRVNWRFFLLLLVFSQIFQHWEDKWSCFCLFVSSCRLHFALHLSLNRQTGVRITFEPKGCAARWS